LRYGITIPIPGVSLSQHKEWLRELADLGYTDVWTAESNGLDAVTPLAVAAAWAPSLQLGTAIMSTFTRGPALMAQTVSGLCEAAPGRFSVGIGTSSDIIVENWNGLKFEQPYRRARDLVRFLRRALAGEKIDAEFDTFSIKGFRLDRPPVTVPPILVAALRPGMLRMAGSEADGAVLNWLSAGDVPRIVQEVGSGKQIVARIFVCPNEDAEAVRAVGRRMVAAYLNVPVYAAFHEWLGRGPELVSMWDAWKLGDRKAALEAIPDRVVDDLIMHGSPVQIQAKIEQYLANGVSVPVLAVLPVGLDLRQAIRDLAPTS
jgi:probable F420-dependent oxidoreductase